MLDPLIDGQDRETAVTRPPAAVEDALETDQHLRVAVRDAEYRVDVVRARGVQQAVEHRDRETHRGEGQAAPHLARESDEEDEREPQERDHGGAACVPARSERPHEVARQRRRPDEAEGQHQGEVDAGRCAGERGTAGGGWGGGFSGKIAFRSCSMRRVSGLGSMAG